MAILSPLTAEGVNSRLSSSCAGLIERNSGRAELLVALVSAVQTIQQFAVCRWQSEVDIRQKEDFLVFIYFIFYLG